MSKIALLSFLASCNYGTLLQDFALARAVRKFGIECEYINYVPYIESKGVRRLLGKIKRFLFKPKKVCRGIDDFSFWKNQDFYLIANKCKEFQSSFIPCSDLFNPRSLERANDLYQSFIVGSDQTWSPNIIDEDSPFLLGFVKDDCKKHSYAPSLGTISVPDSFQSILRKRLSSFKTVSCREQKNAMMLSSLLGKEVYCVLDPTLLLEKEEWLQISKPYQMPDRYVLCYILGEKDCISSFAEHLSSLLNVPVYYVYTRPYYQKKKNILTDVGPCEFITLISKATCVVTDSFHGSIFSINFSVPFYVFTKRSELQSSQDNDRIKEILSEFSLNDRFCEDGKKIDYFEQIDYVKVQRILMEKRQKSLNYLSQILK